MALVLLHRHVDNSDRVVYCQGAILTDEVGLGKTIETGLVIPKKWAERKRRILVITPANLRKQWHLSIRWKILWKNKLANQ